MNNSAYPINLLLLSCNSKKWIIFKLVFMHFLRYLVRNFFPRKLFQKMKDKHMEIKGQKNERYYCGDAVFCPCCGKRFSGFMDALETLNHSNNTERYINTYKNTICPYCLSMPRHRIVCYYLNDNKQIVPTNNILMFGAEFSIKKWFDRNSCHYRTADLFDRYSDIKIDILNIPFPDESWELIICNHVLEHVPDYKAALKELKRILSKDGFLEITVPTDRNFETVYEDSSICTEEDREKYFGQYDHLRLFGNDFEKILKECGFLVAVVDGSTLPAEIGGVTGPVNYDDNRVYICRK